MEDEGENISVNQGGHNHICENPTDNVQELSDRVQSVENENLELKELVQDLITNTDDEGAAKLRLFKDGKYTDSIRIVYMDLFRLGVSIEHC